MGQTQREAEIAALESAPRRFANTAVPPTDSYPTDVDSSLATDASIARKSVESPSWPVSLMALDEPSAASLEAELPRLGNHDYPTLLRKPNVKLCCSN